jgi:hypothetical protein
MGTPMNMPYVQILDQTALSEGSLSRDMCVRSSRPFLCFSADAPQELCPYIFHNEQCQNMNAEGVEPERLGLRALGEGHAAAAGAPLVADVR